MKLVLFTLMFSMLSTSVFAKEKFPMTFEVIQMEGQGLVLVPNEMASSLDLIFKSKLSEKEKVIAMRLMIKGLSIEGKGSFCEVSGETYKSVNRNAAEVADICKDRLENAAGFEESLSDYPNLVELRKIISAAIALAISF